ncbi:MAG: DUF2156 domain-containing protein [Parachlamydiaceae bacterium]|nr:DUF2156 domain-containing protein [Parachlamydiaceae bacterium]
MLQEILNDLSTTERRQKLVALVRKWGDVNTNGLLEETSQTFSVPAVEGFIGYRIKFGNAVVYGDPVCSPENKPLLAKIFQEYCNTQKRGVVYTIATEDFAEWAMNNLAAVTIEFGEKLIFDPQNNPVNNKGPKAVLVRRKVKHALKQGITIREYLEKNYNNLSDIEKQLENVAVKWLQKRHGPQIFLSGVSLFKNRYGKRWFYAQQGKQIIGLLTLNRLESKNGWLLTNVMGTKDAPSGLSEALIISTLQILEKENCHYVLVGPIPAKQLGKIIGISKFYANFTRWLFNCAKCIFNLEGHHTYWEKFIPKRTESSYLIFPQKNLGYSSIKALMQAYNVSLGS